MKPMHSGSYKNLDAYNFISNCCQKCIGGGIAFYIKGTIEFTLCDELLSLHYAIMKEKISNQFSLIFKTKMILSNVEQFIHLL